MGSKGEGLYKKTCHNLFPQCDFLSEFKSGCDKNPDKFRFNRIRLSERNKFIPLCSLLR